MRFIQTPRVRRPADSGTAWRAEVRDFVRREGASRDDLVIASKLRCGGMAIKFAKGRCNRTCTWPHNRLHWLSATTVVIADRGIPTASRRRFGSPAAVGNPHERRSACCRCALQSDCSGFGQYWPLAAHEAVRRHRCSGRRVAGGAPTLSSPLFASLGSLTLPGMRQCHSGGDYGQSQSVRSAQSSRATRWP
jgi:hypothetical protein